MSKIFARLRRATFTILPRAGPLLSFCPKSTASSAFSVLTQTGRTFRIPSDYARAARRQRHVIINNYVMIVVCHTGHTIYTSTHNGENRGSSRER